MIFIFMPLLAISFTVCTSLPASENGPCQSSWVDGSLANMGCLLFHTDGFMAWDDAAAFCLAQQGSKLVSIETEQQMELMSLVLGFLAHHNWWTSGTDRGREGEWYWASTLNQVHLDLLFVGSYIWPTDEPSEGIEANCLSLLFCLNIYYGVRNF